MMDGIQRSQQMLDERRFRLEKAERQLLERMPAKLETASAAVRHYDARRRLAAIRQQLEVAGQRIWPRPRALICSPGRAALDRRTASLEALSPLAILNRGYALVFDAKGQLVKDASRLALGDEMTARLARGEVRARVTNGEQDPP